MKSGNSRRAGRRVPLSCRNRRRARVVGVTVGVLAAAGLVFAPNTAAFDAQAEQWYLGPMQAEKMWKVSTGEGVKVAVIGTGVHETPSLRGQVLPGVDALVKDDLAKGSVTDTDDTTGQGTTAAELIAGTGEGGGLKGLAPGAKIVPIKVPPIKHDDIPDPNYPLATAVKAAVDSGAKIIDFTIGNQYPIGTQFGDAAFDYAVKKGVLMIAGTGDSRKEGNKEQYPAAYPHVVGVAAGDKNWQVSSTSQYGDFVDLAAPGMDLPRWCDSSFQRYCSNGGGTAAAAAVASASAALIWSAHPDWTVNQVVRALIDTAGRTWPKETPSKYGGYGSVRPRLVLENGHFDPGPADVNPLAADDGETTPPSSLPASPSPTTKTPGSQTETTGAVAKPADDDSNALAIGVGAAAAVVVIGGAGYAVMRARRAK
ncbi:serine protease [Streptomyces sp. WAC00469]|nr:serine protease [Streptomyces sp. WAC00469]